jgi:hypothetical protein
MSFVESWKAMKKKRNLDIMMKYSNVNRCKMNLFLYISKCILVSKLFIILGFEPECKEEWGQWIVIDE